MKKFDWHSGDITRDTSVAPDYKITQRVRRFLKSQCGQEFVFDRSFMQWIKDGSEKTMGDVVDEWLRRQLRE